MAKYHGSPWGIVAGKLGDFVGGKWKGINWARILIFPTQRGTLDMYRDYKDGTLPPERFSFPQMNIRRAITQVLGYIARFNLAYWIYPVWEALVDKRGWTMTGSNAFVRRNAATLLSTMDRDVEFEPDTNEPDLTKMLISDGDLEPVAEILTAVYDPITGHLTVTWDPATYTNGSEEDVLRIMVAKKPMLESAGRDGTWYPKLYMYGRASMYTDPIEVAVFRSAGTATWERLPAELSASDLTAYVFFHDELIGFSPSLSLQITEST